MESVYLRGTEEVSRAGFQIKLAAEEMQRAASQINEALSRHENFLNDWLSRFEVLIQSTTGK